MARWFLGVAFLAISFPMLAQSRTSGGMVNGYMWRQMSDENKAYYAVAILELSSTLEDSPRRPVNPETCRCSGAQLIEGVDNFYKGAAANNEDWMRLPVLCVFTGENWRRSGEPLEKISAYYVGMLQIIDALEKTKKNR